MGIVILSAICAMLMADLSPSPTGSAVQESASSGRSPTVKNKPNRAALVTASNSLVTNPLVPHVSHNKVTPIDRAPRMLPLYDSVDTTQVYRWVDDQEARDLRATGQVEFLWSKKRVRGLRMLPAFERRAEARRRDTWSAKSSRNALKNHHFSHDHETDTNPKGVWTFGSTQRFPEEKAA